MLINVSIIRKSQVGEFDQGWSKTLQESVSREPDLRITGVEGEEQWGENATLRGASVDDESFVCEFAQPH